MVIDRRLECFEEPRSSSRAGVSERTNENETRLAARAPISGLSALVHHEPKL